MKSAWKLCAILFLATGLVAQTSTAPKPRKTRSATVTAADVQALKDAIACATGGAGAAATADSGTARRIAQQGSGRAASADRRHRRRQQGGCSPGAGPQQQQAVTELKSDVTDLKSNMANTVVTRAGNAEERFWSLPRRFTSKASPSPRAASWRLKLCGGQRALASDINTPFNAVPMPGAST